MQTHKSDSAAQCLAESEILQAIARELDLDLTAKPERVSELRGIAPDGIDWGNKVLLEVYSRVGHLKGSQPHKVKGDILKLLFLERILGGQWRKILCFGDAAAARTVTATSRSWLAAAAKEFGIEVRVLPHSDETAVRLKAAQELQKMVNAQ